MVRKKTNKIRSGQKRVAFSKVDGQTCQIRLASDSTAGKWAVGQWGEVPSTKRATELIFL